MVRSEFQKSNSDGKKAGVTLFYHYGDRKILTPSIGVDGVIDTSNGLVLEVRPAESTALRAIPYEISSSSRNHSLSRTLSLGTLPDLVEAFEQLNKSKRDKSITLLQTTIGDETSYHVAVRPSNNPPKNGQIKLILNDKNVEAAISKIRAGESIADLAPKKSTEGEEPKDPSGGPA